MRRVVCDLRCARFGAAAAPAVPPLTALDALLEINVAPATTPPPLTVAARALAPAATAPVVAVILPANAIPAAIPTPVPIKAPAIAPIATPAHIFPPVQAATTPPIIAPTAAPISPVTIKNGSYPLGSTMFIGLLLQ